MEPINLAIFDFCDTLVNLQTADLFVKYVLDNYPSNKISSNIKYISYLEKIKFFSVINKIKPNNSLKKKLILYQLKNLNYHIVDSLAQNFINNFVLKNLNYDVLNFFEWHKKNNDVTIICSGGYCIYLKYFIKIYPFDYLLCTKIKVKDNNILGLFDGNDCMYFQKVIEIEKIIYNELKNLKINDIYVYTDSFSDLPLLQFATKPFVISYDKPQSWVNKYNFNEIIVKKNFSQN